MGGLFGGGTVIESAPKAAGIRFQTSSYGRAIMLTYGRTRIAPNLIDYDNFQAIKHKESSGGKGGGGVTKVSYTYTTALLLGLGDGEISAVLRAWVGKESKQLWQLGLTLFTGSYAQSPYGFWATHYPAKALAYRGEAYLATDRYDLGSSPSLPNHAFEVQALLPFSDTIHDALPSAIAADLMSHEARGIGFPALLLGDWNDWRRYATATGLFVSPCYEEQTEARELLARLAEISNTALFFSEGVLKAVPYGDEAITGNGEIYSPNITPVYDLTLDDFLAGAGDAPIRVTRVPSADAYNQVQVKFYNRANDYNEDIAKAEDQANIAQFGLRPMPVFEALEICDADVARTVAQILLQRALYIRCEYTFTLGMQYALLEQMDLVTLTYADMGLDQLPVRIKEIEEDEDSNITVIAEEYLGGVASAPLYPSQSAGGYAPDYNADPGDANPPVIFEPPENLAQTSLEIWILVSGGELWGGCEVWVSSDDVSYSFLATIDREARQGILADALGAGDADPDLASILAVDMSMSGAEVLSGSQADVDAYNTLCYVDGELIAYRDSSLIGPSEYNLSYLRRGVYNTLNSAHAAGTQFVRIDPSVAAKYPFDTSRLGSTIYLKLVSFNIWGGGKQDISDLSPHTYTITGSAMNSPPEDIANLHTNYRANLLHLYWDEVTDFRVVEYEIRTGTTWAEATVLGRVAQPGYPVPGDGDFWVAARAIGSNGSSIYSFTPTHIALSGAILARNIIATIDEAATGWGGTVSGGAVVAGGMLQLAYSGDISLVADITTLTDVGAYGDVSPSGSYTAAVGHRITLADVTDALVNISYDVTAYIAGSGTTSDPGPDVDVIPQVRLSLDGGSSWGGWRDYKPGNYVFSALDWRIELVSRNSAVTPQVSGLVITVDVPNQMVSGHVQTSAAGTVQFSYPKKFNGGADTSGGGAGVPVAQITILAAQAGDIVRVTNKTLQDFDVDVVNAGSRVVRNLDITLDGY